MEASFVTPDGDVINSVANLVNGYWTLDIAPPRAGLYTFWLNAEDSAGNSVNKGTFEVEIFLDQQGVFLPLIIKKKVEHYCLPGIASLVYKSGL